MRSDDFYEFNPDDAFRFASEVHAETKSHGDELTFKWCPYCKGGGKDKNTFSINLHTGQFKCLRSSCSRSGNMISLHKDFGFSLGDDVDAYLDGGNARFRRFTAPEGGFPARPSSIEYLRNRGISENITRRYEITAKKDQPHIIVFPFYDDHNVLWFIKYRNTEFVPGGSGGKEWCEANRKPILFGMNHCNFDNPVLVMTEGQIDSLSVAEAGIENAVSVPTGKNGFTWVPYCWGFLGRFEELIIFGDCENGKITLLDEMKSRFHGTVKVVRVEDYKGCKDANELLQKYGKEAVQNAVENAEPLPVKRLKNLRDVQRINPADMERISTGYPFLDKILGGGFFMGQLEILTGKRGLGKSTQGSQWLVQAVRQHLTTFCYSGELPDWMVKQWLTFQFAGDRYIESHPGIYEPEFYVPDENYRKIEEFYDGKIWLYDNDSYIDDNGNEDVNGILNTLEAAIKQYGVQFALIDNLMTAIDVDGSDLNQQQTAFVKRLAGICKRYSIVCILIVHPRKESANTKFFSNDDVAGSSNITNLADVIIKYDRAKKTVEKKDRNGNITEVEEEDPDSPDRLLTVHKNRINGRTDNSGTRLFYQPSSKRISDDIHEFDFEVGWEKNASFTTFNADDIPDDLLDEIPE